MELKMLTSQLIKAFTDSVKESPLEKLDNLKKVEMQVDYFQESFAKPFAFFVNKPGAIH
jgi:hypothetical protein